jgi:hypothetical protein
MLGLRRRVFVAETDAEAQGKFDAAQDMLAPARGFSDDVKIEKMTSRLRTDNAAVWLLKFRVHSRSPEMQRWRCSQAMSTPRNFTFMSTRP